MFVCPSETYSGTAIHFTEEICNGELESDISDKWKRRGVRLLTWGVSIITPIFLSTLATVDIGIALGKIILSVVPIVNVKRPSLIHLAGLVELLVFKIPFMFFTNLFNYNYLPETENSYYVKHDCFPFTEAYRQVEAARVKASDEFIAILSKIDCPAAHEMIRKHREGKPDLTLIIALVESFQKGIPEGLDNLVCEALIKAKECGINLNRRDLINQNILSILFLKIYPNSQKREIYKKIAHLLLSLGVNPNEVISDYYSISRYAGFACVNNIDLLKHCLDAGLNLPIRLGRNIRQSENCFLLLCAAESRKKNSLEAMVLLLNRGTDLAVEDSDRSHALHALMQVEEYRRSDNWRDKEILLRGTSPSATLEELTAAAAIFRRFGYDPLTHLRILDSNGRPHFEYLTEAKRQFLQDLIGRFDVLPAGEGERKERAEIPQPLIIAQAPAGMLRIKESEKEEMQAQLPSESERKQSEAQPPSPPTIEELLTKAPSDLLWLTYSSLSSISDWIQLAQVFEWELSSQKHWERINISAKQRLERFGIKDCGSTAPLLCLFQNIYDSVYS